MTTDPNQINILWTGGWDSTYRLFYLIVVKNAVVQPYYIIDHRRKSVPNELKAMEKIRHIFIKTYPGKSNQLLPTIITEKKQIKKNKAITHKFYGIAKTSRVTLGSQLDWLARFAHEQGLYGLEICHEKKPSPSAFDLLLLPELIGKGHDCKLQENLNNQDLSIFKYFRFPTVHLTKQDMERLAVENSFSHIMKLTWFCHKPVKGSMPCGRCHPCEMARKTGMTDNFAKPNFIRDQYLDSVFFLKKLAVTVIRKFTLWLGRNILTLKKYFTGQ